MARSVRDLIDLISWDRRVVLIPAGVNAPLHEVMLLHPTIHDKGIAQSIKAKTLAECETIGVPSEDQIIKLAIESGYWTTEEEDLINQSAERINTIESMLLKEKLAGRKRRLQHELEQLKTQIAEAKTNRLSLVVVSSNYLAHEQFVMYLAYRLSHTLEGTRLWTDYNDFMLCREQYPAFVMTLANAVVEENDLETPEIRRIARSGDWRVIWTSSRENLSSLFGKPAIALTTSQKLLVYWSRLYDLAYEQQERPSEEVIENDDKFDIWLQNHLEAKAEKRNGGKSDSSKKKGAADHHETGKILNGYYDEDCSCGAINSKGRGLGEAMPHTTSCNFGVFVPYSEEEKRSIADGVYDKNPKRIRDQILRDQENTADRGMVEEHHLRGNKARMVLGYTPKIHARKR
jgi:hypothetical protein